MKFLPNKAALAAALLAGAGIAHATTRITFDQGLDTSQALFAPMLTTRPCSTRAASWSARRRSHPAPPTATSSARW